MNYGNEPWRVVAGSYAVTRILMKRNDNDIRSIFIISIVCIKKERKKEKKKYICIYADTFQSFNFID